jgi:HlyD family secretion protein
LETRGIEQIGMKRILLIGIAVVAVLGIVVILLYSNDALPFSRDQSGEIESIAIQKGPLSQSIGATGRVRSNQSATLAWKISGLVGETFVETGDSVQIGDVLASIDQSSLSPLDILASSELVSAQKALEDLRESQVQQAAALQGVDAAQDALDEALNPELAQAQALQAIAEAEKEVADAEYQLKIVNAPVSKSALDAAQANLLLAEKKLNDNQDQIERIEKRKNKSEEKYKPWESPRLYKQILEGLEIQRIQLQIAYEKSQQRYLDLQAPPDPIDVAVAEAYLGGAQAQLADAERSWARIENGTSPADIALLEAQLADAQREWERLKDGPDPADISAAEARVAAAQASLAQYDIKAPFNGTVTEVYSQPNDQVDPGVPALRLDDLSHLWVDVEVSEVDINQVEIGQPAILTFDAILAKEYHGVVVEVAPVGDENQGVINFKVTVELSDADAAVRPGMTAAVEIVVSQLDEALLVPNQAVRAVNGTRMVYIMEENGDLKPVEVTLGATSDRYSQLLEGDLQPGDLLVLNPSEQQIGILIDT